MLNKYHYYKKHCAELEEENKKLKEAIELKENFINDAYLEITDLTDKIEDNLLKISQSLEQMKKIFS